MLAWTVCSFMLCIPPPFCAFQSSAPCRTPSCSTHTVKPSLQPILPLPPATAILKANRSPRSVRQVRQHSACGVTRLFLVAYTRRRMLTASPAQSLAFHRPAPNFPPLSHELLVLSCSMHLSPVLVRPTSICLLLSVS